MSYLDPFRMIVNCHFAGGLRLHYSSIYEFDQPGWGAPFQSGDPLTDVKILSKYSFARILFLIWYNTADCAIPSSLHINRLYY